MKHRLSFTPDAFDSLRAIASYPAYVAEAAARADLIAVLEMETPQ